MTEKYYAGIGKRVTPFEIQQLETKFAGKMEQLGWTLLSGGAYGSDRAFESGAGKNKQIFKAGKAEPWAYDELKNCLPVYITTLSFLSPAIQATLARNMMIILGRNGTNPVSFVICYTDTFFTGGTGYGCRCALRHNIPIFNLYDPRILNLVTDFIESEESDFLKYMSEKNEPQTNF